MNDKPKKKILLVDDEKDFAELIKMRLKSQGYDVDRAEDGQQALKKAKEIPDLIILDVMMPNLGGIEVSKILKEDPKTKDIPIIFLTAKRDGSSRAQGIQSGGEYYLTKPTAPDEFMETVKKILGPS